MELKLFGKSIKKVNALTLIGDYLNKDEAKDYFSFNTIFRKQDLEIIFKTLKMPSLTKVKGTLLSRPTPMTTELFEKYISL